MSEFQSNQPGTADGSENKYNRNLKGPASTMSKAGEQILSVSNQQRMEQYQAGNDSALKQ